MVGESSQIAWCSGDIMTYWYFTEFSNDKLQEKQLKIWGHLDNLSHLWWDESSLQNRGMLLGKMFWSRLSEEFAFYYKLEAVVWDLQPVPYVRFFLFGRFQLDMQDKMSSWQQV